MNPQDPLQESMDEQLCALYAEKEMLAEAFPGMDAQAIVDAFAPGSAQAPA